MRHFVNLIMDAAKIRGDHACRLRGRCRKIDREIDLAVSGLMNRIGRIGDRRVRIRLSLSRREVVPKSGVRLKNDPNMQPRL